MEISYLRNKRPYHRWKVEVRGYKIYEQNNYIVSKLAVK